MARTRKAATAASWFSLSVSNIFPHRSLIQSRRWNCCKLFCWSLAWQGLFRSAAAFTCGAFSRLSPPTTSSPLLCGTLLWNRQTRHDPMPVTTRGRCVVAISTKVVTTTSTQVVGTGAGSTRAVTTALHAAAAADNDDKVSSSALPHVVTPDAKAAKRTSRRRSSDQEETSLPPKRPRRGRPPKETKTESDAQAESLEKAAPQRTKKPFAPPPNWQETYKLVEELRQDRTAPCDHSGAEALAELGNMSAKSRRFYSLVALLLSSQTKDAVVAAAMQRMHDDQVLTVPGILALEQSKLSDDYLYSVGFRNNKAKYMQQTCQILQDKYDGDIPPTADAMMELPGVGPKMAYICENIAWNRQSGIGVDTHMHRLYGLLGWVPRDTKTPEQTRRALESWLPHDYWKDVNLLWVGFGQEVQQQKEKALQKALDCSKPYQALRLLERCGMNVRKEAKRFGFDERVKNILANNPKTPPVED